MARTVKQRPGVATARVGNYAADVDTTGMSDDDKAFYTGTKATKEEAAYIKGTGRPSAIKAVQKARKANKLPLMKQ